MRAGKIGRVLIDFGKDRPWSQYFCCMAAANRDSRASDPVATKRALRAMSEGHRPLRERAGAGRPLMVDRGLRTSTSTSCSRSRRSVSAVAGVRFRGHGAVLGLALRRRGSSRRAQKIIAQGTDWRFLNELKRS